MKKVLYDRKFVKPLHISNLIRENTDVGNIFNSKDKRKICENPCPVRLKKLKISISGKSISKSEHHESQAGPSARIENISMTGCTDHPMR